MNTNTTTFFVGKNTMVTSDCIAIAFFRPTASSNDVMVNGVPIEAGQTLAVSQVDGNIDRTQYEVVFTNIGNTNELYVIRTLIA